MDAFAALADPVRRDLLRRLARGQARVVDLAAEHPISRPAVSKHLRLLSDAGLVTVEDHGRERHYRAATAGLAPVQALLDELTAPVPDPPGGDRMTTPPARAPARAERDVPLHPRDGTRAA